MDMALVTKCVIGYCQRGARLVMKCVIGYCQRRAVFAVHFTIKAFNQLYITNKMERFSFKSGHAMRIAELMKEDWPTVLQ